MSSALLTALTLLTPLVDRAEIIRGDAAPHHVTVYGPLFSLYLVHVVYLAAVEAPSGRGASGRLAPCATSCS